MTASEPPSWEHYERAVEAARAEFAEPYEHHGITVAYESDDYAMASVWLKAACAVCEATCVMRARRRQEAHYLSHVLMRYHCKLDRCNAEGGDDE